jgi:hypothetical protein
VGLIFTAFDILLKALLGRNIRIFE